MKSIADTNVLVVANGQDSLVETTLATGGQSLSQVHSQIHQELGGHYTRSRHA